MAETTKAEPVPADRIASIDALRGFDMFWIAGGEEIFHSLHRVIGSPVTAALDLQLRHVVWQGFRFYDLIFPLSLFIVGLVLPFSLTRRLERGANRGTLYRHLARRLALLFLFGLIYNGLLDFNFHELRVAGVLQRIAVCYFLAGIIVMNASVRAQAILTGAILIAYWAILGLIPVPGFGAGALTPEGSLAAYLDQNLLPKPYCCYTFGDNEGVLSTLPAVGTVMLGVLAGHWLRSSATPKRKGLGLTLAGVACLLVGNLWGIWFPIIKNLWTSSYVLVAGGWSLLLLALFYWVIDIRRWRRWAFFFTVIGLNPITIYLLSSQFDFGHITRIFVRGFIDSLGPAQPVVWDFLVMMTGWLFLYFLYRKKIFLKM